MNDKLKFGLLINGVLLAVLALMLGQQIRAIPSAHAIGGGWETHGVMLLPSKGPKEHLVLVDTERKTICVYRDRQGGDFTLSGARNYRYDMELNDSEGKLTKGWTYFEARAAYEATRK